MFQWGGSELVALELIEALQARGLSVTAFVPFADPEFCAEVLPDGVALVTDAQQITLSEFDLVYAQHQTQVPVYAAQDWTDPGPLPVLVCAHLSPWEPMEFPGPFLEPACADLVLANSPETRARLEGFGLLPQPVALWPNPAPAQFDSPPEPRGRRKLRSVLAVSHHPAPEMSDALDLLEAGGVHVTRLGQDTVSRRVMPADIADHDAVVSIGKTVQYALRARRPVFCYDHFAGPGWLGEDGFDAAAAANFSGRCTPDPQTPEALAQALQKGFSRAWSFAQRMAADRLAPFALETRLDDLLAQASAIAVPGAAQALQADARGFAARLDHEAALYALVDRHYGAARKVKRTNAAMAATIDSLRQTNARLEERRTILRDRNEVLQAQITKFKDALQQRGSK